MQNIMRRYWMDASVLLRDPGVAQEGANKLLVHVLQTAPCEADALRKNAIADNDTYMANMQGFASVEPTCRLWQRQGAYKPLFRLLALRFLLAPDQVLDVGSAHARW